VTQDLSPAEVRILRGAIDGRTVVEQASAMRCTPAQIAYRRRKILRKLDARNIAQAVAIALERGLLGGPPRPIEKIGPRQRGLFYVMCNKLDAARQEGNAHDDALAAVSAQAGRDITSVKELSYDQASDAIEWLKAQLAEHEVPA
jgi:DNA-binding CsgD family transcriptional regulator